MNAKQQASKPQTVHPAGTFTSPDGIVYAVEGTYRSGTPWAHDEDGGLVTPAYSYAASQQAKDAAGQPQD